MVQSETAQRTFRRSCLPHSFCPSVLVAVHGHVHVLQDAAFDALHDRYASDLTRIILTMRGFYIKVGQIGSTRADFMPPQFLAQLEKLQVSSACAALVPHEGGTTVKPSTDRCSMGENEEAP